MKFTRSARFGVAMVLLLSIIGGIAMISRYQGRPDRATVVAYFANSNGVFAGDDVRIMGVRVGRIESIEPAPGGVRMTFWYDDKYKVPADAKAAILSPSLVSARFVQLTPAYTTGPVLSDHAEIPQHRTAVPVEWDDFRLQLEKLTQSLQPDQPGGVAPAGAFINTAADNLRGQGTTMREAIVKLAQAFSVLGDRSTEIFGTVRNLSTLVAGLQGSTDLMSQLNTNLASVTGLLANDQNEIGTAVEDLNTAVGDVQGFVAQNREAVGVASDKLASISTAVGESLDDVKQTLHVFPNTVANFLNIYQPAQGSLTGVPVLNNFANPVSFICAAVQAASRLNAEQASKLCVQYLAPIVKNRQYNFPPFGFNPLVTAQARPNEITYSEDWLRPDYVPPAPKETLPQPEPLPLLAESTDPNAGLAGMMTPPGGQ